MNLDPRWCLLPLLATLWTAGCGAPPADDDAADDDSADDDAAPDDDSTPDDDSEGTPVDVPGADTDPWHVMVSSDYGSEMALQEWDAAWNVTWYVPAEPDTIEGFRRQPDGRTLAMRMYMPFREFEAIEYDPHGLLSWQYQGAAGDLVHAHDVVETSGGDLILADTDNDRLFQIGRDQKVHWELQSLPDGTALQGPNGMELGTFDGEERLLVSARTFVDLGDKGFQALMLFRLRGREAPPELIWRFPEQTDLEVLNIPHGPHFTEDGGAIISSSEHGDVIGVDPDGVELWRLPPPRSEVVFDHHRDALFTPDGNLLVADTRADRVMEIGDPFGDFVVLREIPVDGTFRLGIVDCDRDAEGRSTACF